jgi:hypothetical protein
MAQKKEDTGVKRHHHVSFLITVLNKDLGQNCRLERQCSDKRPKNILPVARIN